MKTFLKLTVVLAVLSALGLGLLALWAANTADPGLNIIINGESVQLSELSGWQGLGLLAGLAVALMALSLVLPLVVLLSVALPLLIVGGVLSLILLPLLGAGALLSSPLLLVGLLLWLVLRPRRRRSGSTPQQGER
ncbi:MAG: hypothetical protein JOY60_10610 [Burkholderiaceae bacterium]|nr:hypothetical protein [Roseateles sp.]MBV8470293.1 hypothetical protein [Burkholderiaceae bacterium]